MAFIDSLVVFLVGLAVGGLGIHLGAMLITGYRDYTGAVLTALIGAFVWGLAGFLFGAIPLLGPFLVLLAWLWVIKARYPGGWINAAAIALVAWATVLGTLYVLALLGITGFEAVGVPGV
jgi:hypothetical protein